MTLQEYFETEETVLPQELIYGVLRVADSPTPSHQELVGSLYVALRAHVRERRLGTVGLSPLDIIFDAGRALVLQPDLVVILPGGRAEVTDRVRGAPDLVIEVLSPHPRIGKLDERVRWFAEYGVKECWLVNQIERQVHVLECDDGVVKSRNVFAAQDVIGSRVLPDFQRSLDSILLD